MLLSNTTMYMTRWATRTHLFDLKNLYVKIWMGCSDSRITLHDAGDRDIPQFKMLRFKDDVDMNRELESLVAAVYRSDLK